MAAWRDRIRWRDEPAPRGNYQVCVFCGHVETRNPDLEPPRECENCRAHFTSLVAFDDVDAAEALSEAVIRKAMES